MRDNDPETLLTENEALRSALRRSEGDAEKEAALVDARNAEIADLRRQIARMEARALRAEACR